MTDKTITPIDTDDSFLDKLDFLNTGAAFTGSSFLYSEDAGLFVPEQGNLNEAGGHPENANGQYAAIPGATTKYSRHRPSRARENYDTLARMYMRVPNTGRITPILNSIKNRVSKDVATVMLGDGSAASPALGYVDFFIDNIQTNLMEKVQVTEVLEDNFVAFFFGTSPPSVVVSGHVMNTLQDDWAVQLLSAYEDLFRGTMLARRGLQFYLRYDSYILSGACTALSLTQVASNETVLPFTLQILVHRRHRIYDNAYGTTQLPKSAGSFIPQGSLPFSEPKPPQLRPFIASPSVLPTDSINNVSPTGMEEDWQKDDEVTLDDPEKYTRGEGERSTSSSSESWTPGDTPTRIGVNIYQYRI